MTNCDPNALMEAAKCFKCIPRKSLREILIYLFCQLANSVAVGCNFAWTPSAVTINWTDGFGLHTDNLTNFNATADIPTVTVIDLTSTLVETIDCLGALPSLVDFNCDGNANLTSINCSATPALTTVGGYFKSVDCASLTVLNLSSLVTVVGNFNAANCTLLSSVLCGAWIPTNNTVINFSACALTATSVQLILRRLVLSGVTICTINLSGGTNAGTASLNAQGQADVATLGAQLTINP